MKHRSPILIIVLLSAFLLNCGGSRTEILRRSNEWDQRTPVRLAILPVLMQEAGQTRGAEVLRKDLFAEFSKKPNFFVLEPGYVDRLLQENKLLERTAWNRLPERRLGELLNVDMLMRVKITRFGATYVIIQSNTGAGAEVELIDVPSGITLWQIHKEVSTSRGITGLPTGLSSVVLEPIRGMGQGGQIDLMRQLGIAIAASLDPNFNKEKNAPAVPRPEIQQVRAQYDGSKRYLDVEIQATPDCHVTFEYIEFSSPYPCHEFEPGVYRAGFLFPNADLLAPGKIHISVVSKSGTTTEQDAPVQIVNAG